MSWTYDSLKTALLAWNEDASAEYAAVVDSILMLAETRILRDTDLDAYRAYKTARLTRADPYLSKPDDFLVDRWVKIRVQGAADADGFTDKLVTLESKDTSFVTEYWPQADRTAQPKYYADWDESAFIVAPTPDAYYEVQLAYIRQPEGLSAATPTTWVSQHLPDVLFYAAMLESVLFRKGEQGELDRWTAFYQRALAGSRLTFERRQRRGEDETGEAQAMAFTSTKQGG